MGRGIKGYYPIIRPTVVYNTSGVERSDSWIRYIGNRVLNNNNNMLICLSGKTGCLHKDTILYGQKKTLKDLYDSGNKFIDTISLKKIKNRSGCYYPIKSKSEIIPSGIKEVYEIEFEDGEKVIATKDHKFFIKDKNKIKEEMLSNIKTGDEMVYRPIEYLNSFWEKAINDTRKRTRKKFYPSKICQRCHSLYFTNIYVGHGSNKYCNTCKEITSNKIKKDRSKKWYEWENNLIKQFYYDMDKTKLMELLTERTWESIYKKAYRLKIKRKPELQWGKNKFTSQNNPMNNLEIREKAMKSMQKFYHSNPNNNLNKKLRRNKMTEIEKEMCKLLDSLGINYEWNKYVKTINSFKFPDFRIGNVIIECDGEYWHKNKKEYDMKRQKELEAIGFKVIRFNDKQILNNIEEVKECIQKELN